MAPPDSSAPSDTAELSAAAARENQLHEEIDRQRIWCEQAEGQARLFKGERDAAEERFVRAREEASELEQEVADKMSEIQGLKGVVLRMCEMRETAVKDATIYRAISAVLAAVIFGGLLLVVL
jgi:SMC interacting uncharacterized protein involved in chromosome segregation